MATDLKTVEFWFPDGTACNDVTDTNLTQITVYLPESSITFKSVVLELVVHDRNTTVGNWSRRQLSLQLGAAGYSAVNNTNTITNGGEQMTILCSADFTSYFTTNWTGTSMTCDARFLGDTASTTPLTPSFVNLSCRLVITYEYDDTSTTQIKTVRIPLDCPVGALATSKPGTANATIPALDTELPEASKTYRQRVLVWQGNDNGSSADLTFSMQVDTDTAFASYSYEHGSNCNMFIRMNSIQTAFTTNATHGFYVWCASAACFHHSQAWLVVTYEFDASSSNNIYVHTRLALDFNGTCMGGTTSSDYQRGEATLWIPEPTTITTMRIAAYLFWDQSAAISGLNIRVGTGSFVAYTTSGVVNCGSQGCMVRNDSAYTLARGKNAMVVDVYRSDTADPGAALSGFLMVNYTCGKPTGGHGAATKTREWFIQPTGTTSPLNLSVVSALALTIPQSSYFLSSVGIASEYVNSGTNLPVTIGIDVERLSAEGGVKWESVFAATRADMDGEIGIYHSLSEAGRWFYRWPSDKGIRRFDIETSRRWRYFSGMQGFVLPQIRALLTYHAVLATFSGTISGSAAGTVYVDLVRDPAGATREIVLSTSRSGNGSYSFTWYEDISTLEAAFYEDATHQALSARGTATMS